VPALKSKLKFAISVAEGKFKLMQQTVEKGVSASLGLAAKAVSVTGVTATAHRLNGDGRKLQTTCASSMLALEIESASAGAELTQLKEDLQLAATEGSLVAHVKYAAIEKGVLTECLKDQPLVLPNPVVEETVVVREVVVQQPTTNKNAKLSKKEKILLGVLLPLGILMLVALAKFCQNKKSQEKNEDQPVSYKETEKNLQSSK
jgi:hypothetical protein